MENVLVILSYEPSGEFENFTRMSLSDFEYLLTLISPIIANQDTQLRDSIAAKIRLAIMLHFLATSDSFKSLHFLFKVSNKIISKIAPEVFVAINQVLKNEVKVKIL